MSAVQSLVVARGTGDTVVGAGLVFITVVGEGDVRRRGVVGVFTTIVVAMVVVFATLADSTVFNVDAIARVRGNDTTVEEHVLPKSSRESDHIILPP